MPPNVVFTTGLPPVQAEALTVCSNTTQAADCRPLFVVVLRLLVILCLLMRSSFARIDNGQAVQVHSCLAPP